MGNSIGLEKVNIYIHSFVDKYHWEHKSAIFAVFKDIVVEDEVTFHKDISVK